jgi:hypothetical protein
MFDGLAWMASASIHEQTFRRICLMSTLGQDWIAGAELGGDNARGISGEHRHHEDSTAQAPSDARISSRNERAGVMLVRRSQRTRSPFEILDGLRAFHTDNKHAQKLTFSFINSALENVDHVPIVR